MTLDQIIFLVTSLVILAASVLVVTTPKMIHAALWLILALAGVAVIFVLLQAPFFAVVQAIVYIGAIAVLFIFAVMLTRKAMLDSGFLGVKRVCNIGRNPLPDPLWRLGLHNLLVERRSDGAC